MNIKNLLGYDLTIKTDGAIVIIKSTDRAIVIKRRLKAFASGEYEECQDLGTARVEIEVAGAKLPVLCNGRTVNVIAGLPPAEDRSDVILSQDVCDEMARTGRRHSGRVFCPLTTTQKGGPCKSEDMTFYDPVVFDAEGLVYRDDVSLPEGAEAERGARPQLTETTKPPTMTIEAMLDELGLYPPSEERKQKFVYISPAGRRIYVTLRHLEGRFDNWPLPGKYEIHTEDGKVICGEHIEIADLLGKDPTPAKRRR